MHVGLVMECDYRPGRTEEEAFEEAFSIAEMADDLGLDGVWLAERHFAAPRRLCVVLIGNKLPTKRNPCSEDQYLHLPRL